MVISKYPEVLLNHILHFKICIFLVSECHELITEIIIIMKVKKDFGFSYFVIFE